MTDAELKAKGQEIAERCWRVDTLTLTPDEAATWVDEDIERLLGDLPARKRARARDVVFLAFCEAYRHHGGTIEPAPVPAPASGRFQGWGPRTRYFRLIDDQGVSKVQGFYGHLSGMGQHVGYLDARGLPQMVAVSEVLLTAESFGTRQHLALVHVRDEALARLKAAEAALAAFDRGAIPLIEMEQNEDLEAPDARN